MNPNDPESLADGLPLRRRLLAIASITAGSMLYTLDGGVLNVALPVIAQRLAVAESTAVLLVTVYNLVLAMSLLPLAAAGERIGHRRVFIAGMVLYLVASLGCLAWSSLPALLVFRAMQALAAGGLLSVSMAMIRFVYPERMLGRGLGFNTLASSLGAAIAPVAGGLVLSQAPWQWVFALAIPLAALGLATAHALPEAQPRGGAYDTRGAALCALTFGLVIVGLQALSQRALAPAGAGLLVVGAVAAWRFVRHEGRVPNPVLPVDLLRLPALSLSVAAGLLGVLASTLIVLLLPFRLHAAGLSSAAIGAMLAPYALAVMIVAPTSGMLSDRIAPALLGTLGLALGLAGVLSFAWLAEVPAFLDVAWRIALCGAGFSMFFAPNGRLVVSAVARERAAGASSLLATTRMLGQALASAGLALLLAARLPFAASLLLAAGLAAAALACSAARLRAGAAVS